MAEVVFLLKRRDLFLGLHSVPFSIESSSSMMVMSISLASPTVALF